MVSIRRSAAYRIATNYAAVFVWTILLLGVAVYFAGTAEFRRERDDEIAAELDRLAREPDRAELLRELHWRETDGATGRFLYALFDRRGKRVAGTLAIASPVNPELHDTAVPDGRNGTRPMRLGSIAVVDGYRLVVAADSRSIDRINLLILKFFAIALAVLLAISGVAGWVLGGYLRKRLEPISATANAIVTGDLDLRVPVSERGDEFDAAGHAFNLMLDRIAGLMENLRQVSSDIAHDLRKPLIRLLVQADRMGHVEGAEERVLEIGDEMLALFGAILRIAEVEGGDLERSFEPIDLSTLMREVAESFEPALADAGNPVDWRIEPEITVRGNKELLGQLAANLLDNARIHTPAGTPIRFRLFAQGDHASLIVEDDGPGVAEDDRAKLLQRFYRTEASRTTPGNGLGLSLVAAAVRAHGGSVSVENTNPGLRITVRLPRLRECQEIVDSDTAQEKGWRAFLRLNR